MSEFLTVVGIAVPVLLAYAMLYRHHTASLKLQETHLANTLKVEIFRDFAPLAQTADRALYRAAGKVRSALSTLRMNLEGHPISVSQSSDSIAKSFFRASRRLNSIVIAIERHEIVFDRFSSIQRALGESNRAMLDAYNAFSHKAMLYLPFQQPTGTVTTLKRPTPQELDEFQALADSLMDSLYDAAAFTSDVVIEAQNELLGDLFKKTVPLRRPGDPTRKVLTRDAEARTERPTGGRWT